jgi:hypothetical protein
MFNDNPKLADFGLGKDLTQIYSYETKFEKQVGTAHFADPIQLDNIQNANIQTEIYSLGKIIDYIFSGSIASIEHKYSSIVDNATNKNLDRRYKDISELYNAYKELKNSSYSFEPSEELEKMYKENDISTEKMYSLLIRKDAGNTMLELILSNRRIAYELLEIFSVQYNHELELLLEKLFEKIKNKKLSFPDYDEFGYIAIDLLKEINNNPSACKVLANIVNYCAYNVGRFNIQRLINENEDNKNIPYKIRIEWIE